MPACFVTATKQIVCYNYDGQQREVYSTIGIVRNLVIVKDVAYYVQESGRDRYNIAYVLVSLFLSSFQSSVWRNIDTHDRFFYEYAFGTTFVSTITRNVVTHPHLKCMNHILSQESEIGVTL